MGYRKNLSKGLLFLFYTFSLFVNRKIGIPFIEVVLIKDVIGK
ncbi:hypothetical protein HDE69_003189 [Pedobacter cryoconitis]|uniref:Uncharacterized protein n=1 Tax=Pedobacter cryoconitis TaxID=188932 RepID=A0A7W8YUQ3_9SPHI|nr:hypothetical protein [Pedobacter cryoconitis]